MYRKSQYSIPVFIARCHSLLSSILAAMHGSNRAFVAMAFTASAINTVLVAAHKFWGETSLPCDWSIVIWGTVVHWRRFNMVIASIPQWVLHRWKDS